MHFSNRSSLQKNLQVGLSAAITLTISFLDSSATAQTDIKFTNYTTLAGLDDARRDIAPDGLYDIMAAGGVAGDFNNDGYHDLFMLTGGGSPDRLYINNQDSTFTDHAQSWGIDFAQHAVGASAVDFNNDGFLDIFVTGYGIGSERAAPGEFKLYKNNGPDQSGQYSFTDIAIDAGVNRVLGTIKDGLGSAWGDYDLDGDLDLFVAGYKETRVCNRVFKNNGPDQDGDYTFTDATEETGIGQTGIRGFLPHLVDMNDDLYPDLILIADSSTSKFFINNKDGTFSDATSTARGIEIANGMGVDVGDMNNDGLLDMYISNITYPITHGPGNVLLIQNQDQSYDNTALANGTSQGHWGWGVLLLDLDHDADRDIAETNGYILGDFAGKPAVIFENLNGEDYNEVATESGFIHNGQGRGMVRLDIENDGDLDIAIFEYNGGLVLYRNELITDSTPANQNWIRIKLDASNRTSLAPNGIGTMIEVISQSKAGITNQLLPIHCGSNHCSASPIETHTGLADATTIQTLRVRWADGSFTTLTDVDANQILTIATPFHPADYNDDQAVDINDVFAFITLIKQRSLVADHNGDNTSNYYDIAAFINDFRNALTP